MKPMKLVKKVEYASDEETPNEVILIDHYIWRIRDTEGGVDLKDCPTSKNIIFQDFAYIASINGIIGTIYDEDWDEISYMYDFVKFID
jgi:hypothetical protein